MELKPRMRAAIRQKMGKKTQQIRNSEITWNFRHIVTWRLKAGISKAKQTSTVSQRLS
jgi:hypothetical protein